MTLVAGIDPGIEGGISALDAEKRRLLFSEDMPTLKKQIGGRSRNIIDVHKLFLLLQTLSDIGCVLCAIEQIGRRKGQGQGSGVTSGIGFGYLVMGCYAVDPPLRTEIIGASGWKASLKVSAVKDTSVARAVELFPAQGALFYGPKGGVIDGRAESAMIALYAAQHFLGIRT